MAKEIFRYLRGELNGFYINALYNSLNLYTQKYKDFLSYFKNMSLDLSKMTEKHLYDLGIIAGIFLPRLTPSLSKSALYLTESYVDNETEFSERGLYNTDMEKFYFYNLIDTRLDYFLFVKEITADINNLTNYEKRSSLVGSEQAIGYIAENETNLFDDLGKIKQDKILSAPPSNMAYSDFFGDNFCMLDNGDSITGIRLSESYVVDEIEMSDKGLFVIPVYPSYIPDINTLATRKLRSSFVGDEKAKGYISSEYSEVIDDLGYIRKEFVSLAPPHNVAYSDFFGDEFLLLSEEEITYTRLSSELFIELFKALQWIRYNGVSVNSLCKIISICCPSGLVKLNSIQVASDKKHFVVYYTYNDEVAISNKQQRLNLLQYIIDLKFNQLEFLEYNANANGR